MANQLFDRLKNKKPKQTNVSLKKGRKGTLKKERKKFDFNEFQRSFQSLDTQNPGTWPSVVKMTVLIFIIAAILLLAYALLISKKMEEVTAAEAEQELVLKDYREKESKARLLEEYQEQVAQMQVTFKQLLDQLPKDTRIPDLVDDINTVGVSSNIVFQDIFIENENEKEFFIEQPIRISAIGNYHEFGSFISGLAALPRIITIHDFELINSKPVTKQTPELGMVLHTKTYRSKVTEAEAEETGAAQ